MLILLLPASVAAWTWAQVAGCGIRGAFLRSLLICWAACVAMTETLSPFHALTRSGVAVGWILVILAGAPFWRGKIPQIRLGWIDGLYVAAIAAILAVTAFTAWVGAPNSADAMAYHLPRVIYWMEERSVAFFPTPYLNQIMLQPFAEYGMLHTYLLSGSDRFINLVQFAGFAGSIAAVTKIAEALGLNRRAQLVAGLVCATLPNAILQASGAKNDCVLAFWLAAMTYFAARRQILFLGLALGLALGTKATAYLFAPPMLLCAWLASGRSPRVKPSAIAAVAMVVLALNGPQYFRNYQLSGSILGFDSAQGDGFFRWRNEKLGWKPVVSNALRNLSDQLGARSERWNNSVYEAVVKAHRAFALDPQDPSTTWRWTHYGPPRNTNQEADANNRWHLLLAAIAIAVAGLKRDRRGLLWRNSPKTERGAKQFLIALDERAAPFALYTAGLAGGFLAFCFYLKWQPFFARLELPLFVLCAPLIAWLLSGAVLPQAAVCLFLLSGVRHPLFDNWTRPLRGPNSVLHEPRNLQYFNDMAQFNNRDSYFAAVDRIAATGCEVVGIDASMNQLEYPLQALLLQKNPRIRFVHVNVVNASRRYLHKDDRQPCTVVQLR
jgi:hypothetical protein